MKKHFEIEGHYAFDVDLRTEKMYSLVAAATRCLPNDAWVQLSTRLSLITNEWPGEARTLSQMPWGAVLWFGGKATIFLAPDLALRDSSGVLGTILEEFSHVILGHTDYTAQSEADARIKVASWNVPGVEARGLSAYVSTHLSEFTKGIE